MFSIFENLAKAAISTALLPVGVVVDVVDTFTNDESRPDVALTDKLAQSIADSLTDITE